jgi:DNA-binding NarL/FixJ family response regulator
MNNLILVIDDDASYRNSIALILQMEGFDVRTTDNGVSGLAMIREKRPDLVLCDIIMQGMDGHTVLEHLKSDSIIANIPFIFVTALGKRADMRRGMSEGADDYLSKPFTAEELVAAVLGRMHRIAMFRQYDETSIFKKEFAILSEQITDREREILLLVGHGHTSKEIAEHLGIRNNTVEVHRANLMRKLDATNAASLARWAVIAEQMNLTV